MTRYTQDWLALREPHDHRARSSDLAARLAEWAGSSADLRVMDLGCGSGSNLRYLRPRLAVSQSWTLIDHDPDLLAALAADQSFDSDRDKVVAHDLQDLDGINFDRSHAVVASALMDLVSAAWFEDLARRCRDAGAALLVALNYDGTMQWAPGLEDDRWIEQQFNTHQRGTKAFGPAMGPDATSIMSETLRAQGYCVWIAHTPWNFARLDRPIQTELLSGIQNACLELAPHEADRTTRWTHRRAQLIEQGRSHLSVGHSDLLALPTGVGE